MNKGFYEKVINKYEFEIVDRASVPELERTKPFKGRFALIDLADGSDEAFRIVGDDKEHLAKECYEHFEMDVTEAEN